MNDEKSKSTILVICVGFLLIYLKFHWRWSIITSVVIGLIGILSPFLSRQVEWLWTKLSKLLSYIVPNILLTIIFYFFLFPIALLSRLFNKDPLMLSGKYKTYFIDMNKAVDKKSFENIW